MTTMVTNTTEHETLSEKICAMARLQSRFCKPPAGVIFGAAAKPDPKSSGSIDYAPLLTLLPFTALFILILTCYSSHNLQKGERFQPPSLSPPCITASPLIKIPKCSYKFVGLGPCSSLHQPLHFPRSAHRITPPLSSRHLSAAPSIPASAPPRKPLYQPAQPITRRLHQPNPHPPQYHPPSTSSQQTQVRPR